MTPPRLTTSSSSVPAASAGTRRFITWPIARRRVLGIDQFPGGHDLGSSHGESARRSAGLFRASGLCALAPAGVRAVARLEHESGLDLLHQIGLLQVGPRNGMVVHGVLEAARLHGLAVESLSAAEVTKRFSGLRVPDGCVGVFRTGGRLSEGRAVRPGPFGRREILWRGTALRLRGHSVDSRQ